MRILIFAPVFVRPTETFIYDATCELAAAGLDVRVLTEMRDSDAEKPFPHVQVAKRFSASRMQRIARGTLRTFSSRAADAYTDRLSQRRFADVIEAWRPDVILANYGHGGATISPVASDLGIPLMVSFHGADASRRARSQEWRDRYRTMFDIASIVTGPSDYVCDKLVKLGCPDSKVRKLHYGIRTDRIQFAARSLAEPDETVRLLFVGRLAPKKDPLTLIRSFVRAGEISPHRNIELTMIGDGPLSVDASRLVDELDVSDKVRLMGHQSHDDVIAAYKHAHIYVQHSVVAPDGDEEGLPVSITEALAAGLPVISTRHSGIPEAVHHGENGFLVEEHDIEGMARNIAELADMPESWEALGKHGRALLESEFATPVVQQQLRGLLSEAAGSTAKSQER